MKKYAAILFTVLFLFTFGTSSRAASPGLSLFVDGVKWDGYEQPFFSEGYGQVLLPVQPVFEAAGYYVTTDESGNVRATNSFLTFEFQPRTGNITKNGKALKTKFPLTLRNAGNYVSNEFLSEIEGLEVDISEDQSAVYVKTNRVLNTSQFLEKISATKVADYTSKSKLSHRSLFSYDPNILEFTIDADVTVNHDPVALHMETAMRTNLDKLPVKHQSEVYLTDEGIYEYKEEIRKWVKLEDVPTAEFMEMLLPDLHPLDQLRKGYWKGIQLYEYDEAFVFVQRLTEEDYMEMAENDEENDDEDAALNQTNQFIVTQFDKRTMLPAHSQTFTNTVITTEQDTVEIQQQLDRSFLYKSIQQVHIPSEVIRNAISEKAYWLEIGIFDQFEE